MVCEVIFSGKSSRANALSSLTLPVYFISIIKYNVDLQLNHFFDPVLHTKYLFKIFRQNVAKLKWSENAKCYIFRIPPKKSSYFSLVSKEPKPEMCLRDTSSTFKYVFETCL